MTIKIQKTVATTALLFTDGTSSIKDIDIIGKYSMAGAKKKIEEMQLTNVSNFSVLKIEKQVLEFEVKEEALYQFCMENGQVY